MKLAFAVSSLGVSHFNHDLIQAVNRAVDSQTNLDITLFFETVTRPCLPLQVASMHISEGFGYDGPIVATNFSTAEKILRFPASKRLLYSYDLDWMQIEPRDFRVIQHVYAHPDLKLATRCSGYAKIIQDAWRREVAVIPDCNIEQIIELMND